MKLDLISLIPIYGYSKIGQRCSVGTFAKGKNFSVITAITKGQILGFQIFIGGVNATAFGAFLINLIIQVPDIQLTLANMFCLWIMQASIKQRQFHLS